MELKNRLPIKNLDYKNDAPLIGASVMVSFLFKIFYVFHFTSYKESIFNDMAVYWNGAFRNIWGDATALQQFAIFPPFYIYFLSFFIRLFYSVGFSAHVLHLTIIYHIALYCLSSIFVFLLVRKSGGNRAAAFLAQLFFLFSYTAFNLNALILPDNLSTPLLVIATGLVVATECSVLILISTGLLLGLAIAAKPILVVFGPVFLWHIFTKIKIQKRMRMLSFILGLSLIPFVVVAKNYQISQGKLLGLGVNGGLNFFQGWGQVGKISSRNSEGYYWTYSPGARDELTWTELKTAEPFYHQSYFYQKGLEAIENDPSVLFKKIFWLKKLFFGSLAPFSPRLPHSSSRLMLGFDLIVYLMFAVGLCLTPLLWSQASAGVINFFTYLMSVFFASVYVLGMPERRYLYYIEFLIITLFFASVSRVKFLYGFYKKEVQLALLCLVAFFILLPITIIMINRFTG